MGNQSTTSGFCALPKAFKDWQFLNEKYDSRCGQIKVYQNNSTGESICVFNRNLAQGNLRQKAVKHTHPNILRLYLYEIQNEQQLCSRFQKVTLVYEYQSYDLGMNIDLRAQKKIAYSAGQLWGLMKQVIEALVCLQGSGVYHRDLVASNILLASRDGIPKLWDFSLLTEQMPGLSQVQSGIREEVHLSPEELIAVREKKVQPILNPVACDIFQLGLTLLEASLLERCQSLFDRFELDFYQLESRIQEAGVKYGQEWEAALRKMLAKTAEERGTFESLLALIPAEIEMNIIQTCEQKKKVSSQLKTSENKPSSCENMWFSKNANPITRLAIEDIFNTSQNQSLFNEPTQPPPPPLPPSSKPQQPEAREQPDATLPPRRNSRHSLQSKEINLSSRPPMKSSQHPSSRKLNTLQESQRQIEVIKNTSVAASQENSLLAGEWEELKKQKDAFEQMKKQQGDSQLCGSRQSLRKNSMSVEIQEKNSNSILRPSPSMQSQQLYGTNIPIVQSVNSIPPQLPATYMIPQMSTTARNIPIDPQAAYYTQPRLNNQNLDKKIEEVLQKSKEALTRFNESIAGMNLKQERKPLTHLGKNDYPNFRGQDPRLNFQTEPAVHKFQGTARPWQIQNTNNSASSKAQITEDYITKILAYAHEEILRSQQTK